MELELDKFKRGILSREQLDTLVAENPGQVVISAEGEKDYDIVVVPTPVNNNLRQPGSRNSFGGEPVSGKLKKFVYKGKKKGELKKLIDAIARDNEHVEIKK